MEPSDDHIPAGHGSPVVDSELLYGSEEGTNEVNEAKIAELTKYMIDIHKELEQAKSLRTPAAAKKPAAKEDTSPGKVSGTASKTPLDQWTNQRFATELETMGVTPASLTLVIQSELAGETLHELFAHGTTQEVEEVFAELQITSPVMKMKI